MQTARTMGKAARRRRRSRQKYLRRLAVKDPEKFQRQWAQRLASWSNLARQRAGTLTDSGGRPGPRAFEIVEYAMEELAACGDAAVAMEAEATKAIVNDECCQAVAAAVDRRLYQLSNAYDRQRRAAN